MGRGEGFVGATLKDTWTKPRGVESGEVGGDDWGRGRVLGGKCRQLYLNNNKIIIIIINKIRYAFLYKLIAIYCFLFEF